MIIMRGDLLRPGRTADASLMPEPLGLSSGLKFRALRFGPALRSTQCPELA